MNFRKLLDDVKRGEIEINSLFKYKDEFIKYAQSVLYSNTKINDRELEAFLRLCLNYYVFSMSGEVLITDDLYDICMNTYILNGNERIIYSDTIANQATKWEIKKHEIPGLVGSLNKVYEYDEIKDYYNNKMGKHTDYIIAPKYDGISVAIKFVNGKIQYALTRYDGYEGQDLTDVVKYADLSKIKNIIRNNDEVYLKCEIVMSTESFTALKELKEYSNRRSATSGICSSPKNIQYGKYLTVIPLMQYISKSNDVVYMPEGAKRITIYHSRDLMDEVEHMLNVYKRADFPYRVDGVVIYPLFNHNQVNENDLLDDAVAFKVNTSKAITKIKYAYFSIGRLGNAMPMLKVEPVEVNETIVEDASLGSYNKFKSMNLHENEEVIVYSAGDVIPQVMTLDTRHNLYYEDKLKINKHCPYCEEKLTRISTEYKCENQDCIRVITGRISNFIDKMGIMGFSDKTVEALHNAGYLNNIADLFELKFHKEGLLELEGFSDKSVSNILNDIEALSNKKITTSNLFGALGIEYISEKKARKIFDTISLEEVLNKKPKKIINTIIASDGIGFTTAEVFADFVDKHRDEIKNILRHMKIVDNVTYYGSIVFSGFRNQEWVKKFEDIGIEVANNVTNRTLALVTVDQRRKTSNCKKAMAKDISIYDFSDIKILYDRLKSYVSTL